MSVYFVDNTCISFQ